MTDFIQKNRKINILSWLVIIMGFVSINRLDQYTSWIVSFAFYYLCFILKSPKAYTNNKLLTVYLIYLSIEIIRGIFIADGYWEYKNLITGALALLMPSMLLIFESPYISGAILNRWFKIGLPLYIVALLLDLALGASHLYLGFVLVWGCFIPIITNKKYKIIFLFLLLLMITGALDDRAQAIKATLALIFTCLLYFKVFLKNWVLKTITIFFFLCPAILIFLGIIGKYNFFEEGITPIVNLIGVSSDKSDIAQADTRTFIYVDVIKSSMDNNYIFLGNTPARGNRSSIYDLNIIDVSLDVTKKGERHYNELCHLNVYTWIGLIGLVFYSLFYIRAAYLAVFKSKSLYMQILGCFIAFKWMFGWIEDINLFNIQNISIWMAIAICSSSHFLQMSNKQFKYWLNNLFNQHYKYKQHKLIKN
ncbi:MAG: hypothetical protein ACLUVZ_02440 [Bacteroides stercoris]